MIRCNGELQRRKGNPRTKNSGWRNRSFCTTREGLLRCVREYCGDVDLVALAELTTLPAHHAIPNLDVRGTDQAQPDARSEPLVPKALVHGGTQEQSPRNRQRAHY